jgi:hypothetical protein
MIYRERESYADFPERGKQIDCKLCPLEKAPLRYRKAALKS